MRQKNILFKKVTIKNLKTALAIHRRLFGGVDAEQDFLESIKKPRTTKEQIYWLIKLKSEYIGIIGLYSYHKYPEDVWMGWFGIINKHRRKGYGEAAFDFFVTEASARKYKNIRLYTDKDENKVAVIFYEKHGMSGEIYSNTKDKYPAGNVIVFSKSLNNKPVPPWNNKYLGLRE